MYPYPLFFGVTLYWIFTALGIVAALVVVRFYGDRIRLPARLINFTLFLTVLAVLGGYPCAIFAQALYDFFAGNGFSFRAATFYGGLLGGAAIFLIGYFGFGGRVLPDGLHKKCFFAFTGVAACAILIGHALGRFGCLMAGCCYGRPTHAWYGVYLPALGMRVMPTQLWEALFLLILFGCLSYLVWHREGAYALPVYMGAYGCFRFWIERFRADDRGATLWHLLSPSQLTALVMIVGAILLAMGIFLWQKRRGRSVYEF